MTDFEKVLKIVRQKEDNLYKLYQDSDKDKELFGGWLAVNQLLKTFETIDEWNNIK